MPSAIVARPEASPAAPPAFPPLRERLVRLREMCAGLADSMDESASRLESSGIPPAEALLEDLSQFRRQVADLLSLARPGDAQPVTFAEIEHILDDGERANRCVTAIDRFLDLTAGDGIAASPLVTEQKRAAELRRQVQAGTAPRSTMQELAEARHPWCDLVSLVAESDELDDERWNHLSASVMRHLGPSIATAAARGRIVLESAEPLSADVPRNPAVTNSPFHTTEAENRTSRGDRASVPKFSKDAVSDSVLEDEQTSSPTTTKLSSTAPQQGAVVPRSLNTVMSRPASAIATHRGENVLPDVGEPSPPSEADRLQALAKIALGAADPARCVWISELILELVAAGRPGLAYHLARCLEERRSRACASIPSSLIRFWTIGQGVLFPRGELAAILQGDLVDITSRTCAASDESWAAALSLLTRAAILRPAIVAPATKAASWLRSLPRVGYAGDAIARGVSQLDNYCSRVSSDSERLGGFRMGLVRRGAEGANLEKLRDDLAADIRRWLSQPPPQPLRYEATTPLFLKAHWTLRAPASSSDRTEWAEWQRAGRTMDAIIGDILADRRQEAPRLKAEMDRISHDLLPSLPTRGRTSGQGPGDDRNTELRDRLLQVLSFGQRWLAILAMPTSDSTGFLPQAAEDLLREIRSRQAAVLEELEALQGRTTSRPVRTAIAILATAIRNVRRLVESEDAGGMSEPDPRHLLHAELLKIPTLRLDAAWEPELDRRRLEDEILKSLTSPDVDWATAFRMRITIDDRDSAARILSLTHWTSAERDRLQKQLDDVSRLSRNDDGWSGTQSDGLVGKSGNPSSPSTSEHAALLTRLERLRTMLQADLDAAAAPAARPIRPNPTQSTPSLPRTPAPDDEPSSASVFD